MQPINPSNRYQDVMSTPGHILRKILDCTGGAHGERAARAYNGSLGAEPHRGSGAEPLVGAEKLLSF